MISKISEIIKRDNNFYLVLEETLFRAKGGGQPADKGLLVLTPEQQFQIVDVIKEGDKFLHQVIADDEAQKKLINGVEVDAMLDDHRRLTFSRMHSGQHMFFRCIQLLDEDAKVEKVDLDLTESSLFVISPTLNINKVLEAETHANKIIKEGRPVIRHEVTKEEVPTQFPQARIKLERIKDNIVSITEIKDFDYSACCGTHVNNTTEIETFFVTRFNALGKNRFEIRFKVDPIDDLFMLSTIARKLQVAMKTDYPLMEQTLKNMSNSQDLLKEQIRILSKAIVPEYQEIKAGDFTLLFGVFPGIEKKVFQSKAVLDSDHQKNTILCLINKNQQKQTDKSMSDILFHLSPNLGLDAGELLKNLYNLFDGKGGGRGKSAQGTITYNNETELVEGIKKAITLSL